MNVRQLIADLTGIVRETPEAAEWELFLDGTGFLGIAFENHSREVVVLLGPGIERAEIPEAA